MTSVRHTNGDYLSGVTPTQTGNWTICCWIKIATYGGTQGIIACNDGDVGWDLRVSSTAIAIHIFNDFASTSTNVITGSDTDWIAFGIRHSSGSDQIDVSTWKVGQGSLTTVSDSFNGWQSANTNYIGQDGFGAMLTDGSTRNFFARADRLSDSDLLTAMQSLTAPAGTNLVYLDLDSPTNAGVNAGTGANYTVVGTLQTDPTEPALSVTGPGTPTLSPLDDAFDVARDTNLVLTFGESVQAGSGNVVIKKTSDNSTVETIDITDSSKVNFSGGVCTINPSTILDYGTGYYVEIDSGAIESAVDNEEWPGFSGSAAWNFTTIFLGPQIVARNLDSQATNATSFTIDIPGAGSIQADDIAIIGIAKDDDDAFTGTFPPTGWQLGDNQSTGASVRAAWIWRRCNGTTDGTTITVTGDSEQYASRGWLIRGAHTTENPVSAVATGSSTNADPPSLDPAGWGTEDTLWLYYVGWDALPGVTGHPSGWFNTGSNGVGSVTQAYGEHWETAGSVDPGNLTSANEQWIAYTIAIRPAPVAAVEDDNNAVFFGCNF